MGQNHFALAFQLQTVCLPWIVLTISWRWHLVDFYTSERFFLKHFECHYFLEQQQQFVLVTSGTYGIWEYCSNYMKMKQITYWSCLFSSLDYVKQYTHLFCMYFIWFDLSESIIHLSTASSGICGSSSASKEFRISLSLGCSSNSSLGIPRHSQGNLEMYSFRFVLGLSLGLLLLTCPEYLPRETSGRHLKYAPATSAGTFRCRRAATPLWACSGVQRSSPYL